jgi:N-methylhydantoinase A
MRAVPDDDARPTTTRTIRLFGRTIEATVRSRATVTPGDVIVGPAILNQMDTTTLIPPNWQASLAQSGALILHHAEPQP